MKHMKAMKETDICFLAISLPLPLGERGEVRGR